MLAQEGNSVYIKGRPVLKITSLKNKHLLKDTIIFIKGECKNLFITSIRSEVIAVEKQAGIVNETKVPFIVMRGNILYNFSYRSYIDTPFAESNVMQHLVQTNLNLLVMGKYPLRLTISNRSSNSPYFKNATDINVEFNRYQLLNAIKEDLRRKIPGMVNAQNLLKAEQQYKTKLTQAQQLQTC